MEPVRMSSDFKNTPRIGQKFIQSTAGAVSIKSTKGELIVEKVNVHRYIAGKKPEWAPDQSDTEESDEDENEENDAEFANEDKQELTDEDEVQDEAEIEARTAAKADHGRRMIAVPEVVAAHDEDDYEKESNYEPEFFHRSRERPDESSDEEMLDEKLIEEKRSLLRRKVQAIVTKEKDLLDIEDEDDDEEEEEEESSEYEEYSDSDDEAGLRLKPVFVRKNDRVTIQDREKALEDTEMTEEKAKKLAEERKRQATRLVNEIIREELKEQQQTETTTVADVNTDDENDEEEYEAWKVRELKRIKRDKEEKEAREREQMEVEKRHGMTEDQRREELRKNPRVVTNKASKGKYKFLQKYYHRGAFFLNEEDDLLKRDFTAATLEDHFDKTVLPKAMQVKNFGRSGRTKYTHLVDQDTTEVESPWFQESAQSMKFHAKIGGGQKQVFEKPSVKKKR